MQPFLALAKSANSPRAASDLVTRATSQPTTFVFTELLQTPQIQALSQSPEHSSQLTLLQIFSYGTYTDYTQTPNLPRLNDAQTLKLRQLTLLTLARSPANLTYKNLLKVLELNGSRALEDLVITCIYAGLIEGKLDPHNQIVSITSVAPLRDLSPDSVPAMLATFQAWSNRCDTTLKSLEQQIASIKATAMARKKEEIEYENKLEGMIDGEKNDGKGQSWADKSNRFTRSAAAGVGAMFGGASSSGNGKRVAGMGVNDEMEMDLDDNDGGDGRGGKQRRMFQN